MWSWVPTSWFVAVLTAAPLLSDTRGLIEQALDEPTKISLENVKLADAVQALTEQTGVRIVMAAEVMALIPQGSETRIQKVDIANIPLREGLTRLFAPLGMTWVVREDALEIVPKEAIVGLGRSPTWAELQFLAELSSTQPGLEESALTRLQPRVQFQVPELGSNWSTLATAIRSVGAGPGDEVLTAACAKLGWAWSLNGDRIVVMSLQHQVRRLLQQPISLRMNNRPLFDVLTAVGAPIRLPVRAEPGTLAALPPNVQRNFSLNVQDQPVEQVLDSISAYTGLGYLIGPDGVMFYRPEARGMETRLTEPASVAAPPSNSDPYVAKMVIPIEDGKTVEWLIRRSELPEDLRQMRDRDLNDFIESVRKKAAETSGRP